MRIHHMKLCELFSEIEEDTEQDSRDHNAALKNTGFWGKAGAGGLILAKTTGKFLLAHRSIHVEQPNTWGVWGGAVNRDATPKQTVIDEIGEETGYHGKLQLIPLFVYKDPKGSGFEYHNFLVLVDNEFTPNPEEDSAWETSGYKWCEFGKWPSPLHFGLVSLFNDSASIQTIKAVLRKISSENKNPEKQKTPEPAFV